jgi:hypothetical protein
MNEKARRYISQAANELAQGIILLTSICQNDDDLAAVKNALEEVAAVLNKLPSSILDHHFINPDGTH